MGQLRESLETRDTDDLQRAIREGALIPEAAALAGDVLTSRGAVIPVAKTEDEQAAEVAEALRASARRFVFAAVGVAAWLIYALATDMFDDGARLEKSVFAVGLYLWLSLRRWR